MEFVARGATAMTAHVDTFARDNLPPRAQWPDFRFELPELQYPDRMNCVVYWGSGAADALETLMATPGYESFAPCDTASDDICLIAFTSGTTGEPKGTMHFHRDILATCDSYGRHVLRAEATDRFIGSPPLAFTFGLGGLVLFPLRVGAATIVIEKSSPDDLLQAIG